MAGGTLRRTGALSSQRALPSEGQVQCYTQRYTTQSRYFWAAQIGPNAVELAQMWPTSARNRPSVARLRPSSTPLGPDLGPKSVPTLHHHLPDSGPNSVRFGQTCSGIGRNPNWAKFGTISARNQPVSAKDGPESTETQIRTKMARPRPEFSEIRPELARNRMKSAWIRPNVARPNLAPNRPTAAPFHCPNPADRTSGRPCVVGIIDIL